MAELDNVSAQVLLGGGSAAAGGEEMVEVISDGDTIKLYLEADNVTSRETKDFCESDTACVFANVATCLLAPFIIILLLSWPDTLHAKIAMALRAVACVLLLVLVVFPELSPYRPKLMSYFVGHFVETVAEAVHVFGKVRQHGRGRPVSCFFLHVALLVLLIAACVVWVAVLVLIEPD
mmetsp:Transcript_27880/g.69914  ORF Transcript_27880/g.69914 Transcript_27880/m.69914 type:complete len:178 (-) Transcript_27880:93-626(-)